MRSADEGLSTGDHDEEEEEVVELSEEDLLRFLDTQEPALQVLPADC